MLHLYSLLKLIHAIYKLSPPGTAPLPWLIVFGALMIQRAMLSGAVLPLVVLPKAKSMVQKDSCDGDYQGLVHPAQRGTDPALEPGPGKASVHECVVAKPLSMGSHLTKPERAKWGNSKCPIFL